MRTDLGCFLKGLAAVFAVLLVLLLPAVLFAFNIPVVFLDANAYKNALEDQEMYAAVIDELVEEIVAEEFPPVSNYSSEMYQDAIAGLFRELFSEEWLQGELEKVIDDGFDFLNSDARELHTSFSMPPLEDRLRGREGEQIIRDFLAALPPCEPGDWEDLLYYMDSYIAYCSPPTYLIEPYIDDIQGMLLRNWDDLELELPIDAEPDAQDYEVLQGYRAFRTVMVFSPLFVLFLAVVIMALAVRSIDGLMYWMGIPVGIGSLFALGSAAVLQVFTMVNLKATIVDAVMEDNGDLPIQLVNAIGGVFEQVVGSYFIWIMIESGILLVLSLLAIGVGLLYRQMQKGF